MWIIAAVPFWIIGIVSVVGAIGQVDWTTPKSSNQEAYSFFGGLALGGICLVLAAKIAS